ncbi:CoA transferase [Mycolicibacterium litorale]|uniref:CoA transferase n=1 Tax=Mycolicibacterium litorale TaxID=758802 RepID=UPI001E40C68D|nr:CoA transferase [Mycolicibacterium litorale]
MADLGAEVIRIDPVNGPCSVDCAPFWLDADRPRVSLFERFVNAGKKSVTLELRAPEAERIVSELLASADIVLESPGPVLAAAGWPEDRVAALNPRLIRVQVSPYGASEVESNVVSDDLVLLGAGGLLSMGGYPDIGPVAVYGQQTTYMASIFGAVAAIAGLIGRHRGAEPETADVSAQECVAQALEESVMRYAMTGEIRSSQGEVAKEAGTGSYRCADGYVSMVAGRLGTAAAWDSLVRWLAESDSAATVLTSEQWSRFEFRQRPESIEEFRETFERFAATRTRQELYREAQERGIALSPVNDLNAVMEDAQLLNRSFFVELDDPELARPMTYPGLPYSMSGTPLRKPQAAPRRGADNADIYLKTVGLSRDELESLAARGVL